MVAELVSRKEGSDYGRKLMSLEIFIEFRKSDS
ncbi:hypothetical protein Gotur_001419 [Gossypium turneri]